MTEIFDNIGLLSIYGNWHARRIADLVFGNPDLYWRGHEYREVHATGLIPYVIGFFAKDFKNRYAHYRLIDCDPAERVKSQKPAIIHWVGTDIINAQAQWEWGERRMFEKLSHPNIVNLVHLDEHLEEMKCVMPDAHYEIVPLPPYRDFEVSPFQSPIMQPVISVYMPGQRQDFFNMPLIKAAAKKFPDARFEFYHHMERAEQDEPIEGTINCFRVPARDDDGMKKQISRSKLFIRVPVHDGLSVQVLEFATAGRSVIYNKDLPHLDYFEATDNHEDNVARLVYLIKQALARKTPNEEMAQYYRQHHSRAKYLNQMAGIIRELVRNQKREAVAIG